MTNIATVEFTEQSSGDAGIVILDAGTEGVRLSLSLRANGDTEAVLSPADARHILHALAEAIRRAEESAR